jgi:murein DD-endopeptidase MepM/ murein hydrolase activator NlpD
MPHPTWHELAVSKLLRTSTEAQPVATTQTGGRGRSLVHLGITLHWIVACTPAAPAAQGPGTPPITIHAQEARTTVAHPIARGDRLEAIMRRYGVHPPESARWIEAAGPLANLQRIEAGRYVTLSFSGGELLALRYDLAGGRRLAVERVVGSELSAFVEEPPVIVKSVGVRGIIRSGFFADARDAGVPDVIISRMVDLLSGSIDFSSEVVPGDRFRLVFEERCRLDGRPLEPGRILAAEYVGLLDSAAAFLYSDEDGEPRYVGERGQPVDRDLLRYPVEFTHISSGFSLSRLHPLLKQDRPHLGVDFAAAAGTPVRAVGPGTVRWATWKGELGRHVEIDHGDDLVSSYSHLRAIHPAIVDGLKVERGRVIGWVGQSGLATGPHLHFALFEKGEYRDPLSMIRSAGTPPVDRERFRLVRSIWMAQLRAIPGSYVPVPSSAPEALSALAQARREGSILLTL